MQMRTLWRNFFLATFFIIGALFLGAGSVPALAEANPPAQSVPAETLFYSASLNQSLFISDKEALCNVRVSVKVLQGNLDRVSFEMLGQGEVESVNGEQVKDWGIRNSGARRFVEIRPQNPIGRDGVFNATIVGRIPLELPTTLYPLIFASVDATAWAGIVRIVSLPDLRLYARHSRGLIPIGNATQTELSFGINASPSLRLDVARANELLAPVSLESFSLRGRVEKNSAHFQMRATANVRELGAEIPVLSGEAALRNFPANSVFSVRTEINPKTKVPTYFLKFPQRGDFQLDLEFDALIRDVEGWRVLNFAVPAVQVAPFALDGLGKNVLFAPSSVSVPQLRGNAYESYLPANGEFNLRWQNVTGTPPEFSACVFSADTCSEWRIATGLLKQREEIQLMISQGMLSNLVFNLYGEGDIVNVSGEDVLVWHVEKFPDGRRELHVALSQKKRGAYSLRVESITAFSTLPATVSPTRIVPVADQPDSAVCVRFNEFLRLRNDGFVRFDVIPQPGLTQVATGTFPQRSDYFEKGVPAENSVVYRLATGTKGLSAQVEQIRPDVSVKQASRCYFDDSKIVSICKLDLTVRDAPLYEWTMKIPEDFSVSSVDSEKMASYEIGASEGGFRDVKIVFTEPLLGEHELVYAVSKDGIVPGKIYEVSGVRYPQARFVGGFIGLGGSQKVRLIPIKMDGMTEVPVEFYPITRASLPQQVFRVRDGVWSAKMRVEKMQTELRGEVSTVYSFYTDKIVGNAAISYDSGNELVGEVRFALPENASLVRASGEGFDEPQQRGGEWEVVLRTPKRGKFSLVVDFEMPSAKVGTLAHGDFSGVKLLNVSGENGEIFITSSKAVAISSADGKTPAGKPNRLLKLARSNVAKTDFALREGQILLGAYQYVERPLDMNLDFVVLPEKAFPQAVITEVNADLTERRVRLGDLSLFCDYKYISSGTAERLSFRVPAGMDLVKGDDIFENEDGTYSVKISDGAGTFRLVFDGISREKEMRVQLPEFSVPVLSTRVSARGEFANVNFENGRKLNESRKSFVDTAANIFANTNFGMILVSAGCILAGTLILLLTPRHLNFVLRCVFGVVAAFSVMVILALGTFVLFRALSPSYQASVAYFGPEKVVDFSVVLWSPFLLTDGVAGLSGDMIGGLMFLIGILFLATGSVAVRSVFMRILGRVLFYGSALFSVSDIQHHVPALVLSALAVETFLLLVELCFAVKKKFSFSSVPAGAIVFAIAIFVATGTFSAGELRAEEIDDVLDDGFEMLAVQSEVRGNGDEEFSRPQNIAERISQAMKILPDRVVSAGEIRVKGRAGERFDLLASPAVLTNFEKSAPDSAIRLERRRGKGGIVYQVVLERAGTFSANFAYELALKPESRGIALLSGNASADVVSLVILRQDIRIGAENAVTLDVAKESAGAQFAQIVFKPVEERKIFWNPRERERSGEPLVLFSEGASLYVPAAGIIEGYHTLRLTPSQGEFDSISVKIPEPFSVSRVEGNSIRRWNFGRDRTLTVLFDSKKSEPIEVSVYTQAALDVSAPQKFAALMVFGCERSVRTVGIATAGDLQVDEISAPKLVPLDEKEFPQKLIERALANEPAAQLRRAFRTVSVDSECRVVLSEVKPNLRISSVDKIVLNRDKVVLSAVLTAQVSRADVFNLTFVLPDSFEVESISGEALGYWAESREDGVRKATLYLKKQFSGEEKFSVVLAGAFPVGAQSWSVPRIVFEDAKQQFGEAFIFTEEGLRLSMRSREDVVETLPGDNENEELQKADFALRYFGRKWNALFNIGSSQARAEAVWTQEVFPRGRYALVETRIVYSVENAMRQIVRVRLPQGVLAARFFGDQVINVGSVENVAGENLWEVRLAKPMRGEIPFSVRYFVPLMPETKIESLSVQGVSVERGVALVHSENILDMAELVGGNAEFLERDGLWVATDFAGKNAVVKAFPQALADWQSAETDVSDDAFSEVSSSRFSSVSEKGTITEERISLKLAYTELLRIAPGKSELLSVSVNGVPEKVFSESSGAFYLPLYKNGADEKCEIVLLYGNAFSGEFNEVLPVVTSATPAKIVWGFRGNSPMCPVSVLSVFGLNAADASSVKFDAKSDFVGNGAKQAFESRDGKGSSVPALVLCSPLEVAEESPFAKTFLLIFIAVILSRILLPFVFRRKR